MRSKRKILIIAGVIIAGLLIGYLVFKDSENQSVSNQRPETVRYFLSQVGLVENRYTPSLIKCLFDDEGNELYRQWSAIYYPDNPPYEVGLVRVEFNKETHINDTCFIKEIITEKDWEMVEVKYYFSKEKFEK